MKIPTRAAIEEALRKHFDVRACCGLGTPWHNPSECRFLINSLLALLEHPQPSREALKNLLNKYGYIPIPAMSEIGYQEKLCQREQFADDLMAWAQGREGRCKECGQEFPNAPASA